MFSVITDLALRQPCCTFFTIERGSDEAAIRGLTVVNNQMFMVRARQSQINVYDAETLRASRDITVPDMRDPVDLVGFAHK